MRIISKVQLTREEMDSLTSQFAISKPVRGGRRTLPYAFTEHGAIMAANILNSPRAVQMSIYVIRAFVKMRGVLSNRQDLAASAFPQRGYSRQPRVIFRKKAERRKITLGYPSKNSSNPVSGSSDDPPSGPELRIIQKTAPFVLGPAKSTHQFEFPSVLPKTPNSREKKMKRLIALPPLTPRLQPGVNAK
jgi:hypothetical protein